MSGAQARGFAWSQASGGLRLGVAAAGPGAADLRLENVGERALEVLSHVSGLGTDLDWYTLLLEEADGPLRTLRLERPRNRSLVERAHLRPGAHLTHRVDVAAWAADAANGGRALVPGSCRLSARYEVGARESGAHWRGRLEAGPVPFTAPVRGGGPSLPDAR